MNKLVKQFMLISFLVGIIPPASAQFDNVGSIIFPTSESGEAQQSFLRGVAILHSFGWEQAQEQFQKSARDRARFRHGLLGRVSSLQSSFVFPNGCN